MPDVVGVRFKACGKIYDFEPDEMEIEPGDLVVVESDLGINLGSVIKGRRAVEDHEKRLKKIIRKATGEDILQKEENKKLEKEARDFCLERIMARNLPMKLISTEATLDRKRIIFYFTAEKRIDFRELVKDLASRFKTRIEMRQIGVRDSARIIGSLGICGRELCCTQFLTFFEPISIKMAKKQELVLNTNKLSGSCGRLMCCLGFEYTESDSSVPVDSETIPVAEDETGEIVVVSSEPLPEAEPLTLRDNPEESGEGESPYTKKERRRKWFPRKRKKRPPPK
jgi:cell fate regulator YaaT (PSP1 superfamily)